MSKDIYIVYETTNLINGKYYIGVHKKNKRKYLGSGDVLKVAVKKYGKENFIVEILKNFDNKLDAYDYEKEIISNYMMKSSNCYNICEGGYCGPSMCGKDNPFYGRKHTKETINKIKKANTGKQLGKDNPFYGRKHTKEANQKNREAHLGKSVHHTEETKKKISEGHKGENAYNSKIYSIYGKIFYSSYSAGKFFNVYDGTIRNWCKNKNKTHCYCV